MAFLKLPNPYMAFIAVQITLPPSPPSPSPSPSESSPSELPELLLSCEGLATYTGAGGGGGGLTDKDTF